MQKHLQRILVISFYNHGNAAVISGIDIDLDRCVFHQNFNIEKRDKLLREHAEKIEMDAWLEKEQWFTLRAKKPGVSARALAKEYGLEELTAYKTRSQISIDQMRGYRFAGKTL